MLFRLWCYTWSSRFPSRSFPGEKNRENENLHKNHLYENQALQTQWTNLGRRLRSLTGFEVGPGAVDEKTCYHVVWANGTQNSMKYLMDNEDSKHQLLWWNDGRYGEIWFLSILPSKVVRDFVVNQSQRATFMSTKVLAHTMIIPIEKASFPWCDSSKFWMIIFFSCVASNNQKS